jgi:hypothetical protein
LKQIQEESKLSIDQIKKKLKEKVTEVSSDKNKPCSLDGSIRDSVTAL